MAVSAESRAARQSTLVAILADAMTYVTMRDGVGWRGVLEAGAGVAHLASRRPQHVTEHQKQLEDGKYFCSTSRTFQIAEKHLPGLPCHPMIHLAQVAPLDSRLRGNA